MGLGPLFNLAAKFLGGAGASPQPANIKRTEAEQKSTTPIEQVNAAVVNKTNPQELNQLHARPNIISATITPEIITNQTVPFATNQQRIEPLGVELKVSSEVLRSLKSILSKAVNNLPILATIYNGIKNGEISPTNDSALKPILPLIRDSLKSGVLAISTEDVNKLMSSIFKNPDLNLTPANTQAPTSNPV